MLRATVSGIANPERLLLVAGDGLQSQLNAVAAAIAAGHTDVSSCPFHPSVKIPDTNDNRDRTQYAMWVWSELVFGTC